MCIIYATIECLKLPTLSKKKATIHQVTTMLHSTTTKL